MKIFTCLIALTLLVFTACGPQGYEAVVDEDDVTPDVPERLKPVTEDDLRGAFHGGPDLEINY